MLATGRYTQNLMGPTIGKESFKSINCAPSYSPGQGEFKNVCFVSITQTVSVMCVCIGCGKCKQNHQHFFGKTASIDERTINLKVISKAYLIGQSLVNISS